MLAALAVPPEVVVQADHAVHGVVEVAASPEIVRARIADPRWVARVDGSGTKVELVADAPVQREGCVVTDRSTPNAIATVRSRIEQCPTASGFVETLVASKSFDAYRVDWTLEPHGTGTRITYHLAMSTSMMVPQFVIDSQSRKAIEAMLTKLQGAFAGAVPP